MKHCKKTILIIMASLCIMTAMCACVTAINEQKDILTINMADVYIESMGRYRLTDYEEPEVVVCGSLKDKSENQISIYDNDGNGWKQRYVFSEKPTEQEPANLVVLGSEDMTGDGLWDLVVAKLETGSAWGYEATVISFDGETYREVYRYGSSMRNTDAVYHDGNKVFHIIARPVIADDESNADPHRMEITVYGLAMDSKQEEMVSEVVLETQTEDKYEKMSGWEIEQVLSDCGFLSDEEDYGEVSPIRVIN